MSNTIPPVVEYYDSGDIRITKDDYQLFISGPHNNHSCNLSKLVPGTTRSVQSGVFFDVSLRPISYVNYDMDCRSGYAYDYESNIITILRDD